MSELADKESMFVIVVHFTDGESIAVVTTVSEALRLAHWFANNEDMNEGLVVDHYENDQRRILAVRHETIRAIS